MAKKQEDKIEIPQFSTNEVPLCSKAAFNITGRCLVSVSRLRATKVAPAAKARLIGLKGLSIEPSGVDLVIFPTSEVGEYCPFVKP